jgi:hypothetical protein
VVLAGCSAGAAAGTPTSTTGTVPIQYTPTTTTLAPAVRTVATPLEPACTSGETKVETVLPTAQEGSVYLEVVVGAPGRRCSIDGYPSFRLYGPVGGHDVALPAVAVHEAQTAAAPLGLAPVRLDLGPQQGDTTAYFVQIPDSGKSGTCHFVQGFAYAPPGAALGPDVDLAVAASGPTEDIGQVEACGSTVQVSAFEVPDIPDISG